MKGILKTTSIIILFLFSSCEKKDDENTTLTPLEQLPPKTQIGANTAGCLVDGVAIYSKDRFNLFYINQKDLGVSFRLDKGETRNNVLIGSLKETLEVGKKYILEEVNENSKYGGYTLTEPFVSQIVYRTSSKFIGELIITHHNYDNATISGEFWFDAVDENGNKVEVREGRFDGKY